MDEDERHNQHDIPEEPMTTPCKGQAAPDGPRSAPEDRQAKKAPEINWDKWIFVATAVAAGAALWLLRLQQQTLIASQRAWVLFDTLRESSFKADGSLFVTVIIKNFGNGPALDVSVYMTAGDAIPHHLEKNPPARSVASIGPGQLHLVDITIPSKFLAADQSAYVYGLIAYKDQFLYDRWSTFCTNIQHGSSKSVLSVLCPRLNAAR